MREIKNFELSSWRGGRYWDLWMIIHILSGALIGFILKLFGFSYLEGFVVVLVLAILWEVYETASKIFEPIPNRIIDIIVGVAGFMAVYKYLPTLGRQSDISTLVALVIVLGILNLFGWSAYKKRREAEE